MPIIEPSSKDISKKDKIIRKILSVAKKVLKEIVEIDKAE